MQYPRSAVPGFKSCPCVADHGKASLTPGIQRALDGKDSNRKRLKAIVEKGIRVGKKVRVTGKLKIFSVKYITRVNYTVGLEDEKGVSCGSCSPHNLEVVR